MGFGDGDALITSICATLNPVRESFQSDVEFQLRLSHSCLLQQDTTNSAYTFKLEFSPLKTLTLPQPFTSHKFIQNTAATLQAKTMQTQIRQVTTM